MNGIDNIVSRIASDAQQEADSILRAGEEQAQAVLQRCREQAERETAQTLQEAEKQAKLREERLVNAARLEARKQTLAAKQEMVDEAFRKALELLCALPEEEYASLLSSLAAASAVTGREQVILAPRDRARYGKQVVVKANELLADRGKLTLSEQSREMAGGVILKEEKIETNCSFEVLLHLKRDSLVADVAGVLFA